MKTPFSEDDYFQGSTMSFGEHIEELRKVLLSAIYGLVIALLLGFFLAQPVVKFFKEPLEKALSKFYLKKATTEAVKRHGGKAPVEMLNLMRERQLVPEYEQLEPTEFLANLRNKYPGQLGGVTFSASAFSADDFRTRTKHWYGTDDQFSTTAAALGKRLVAEGEASDAKPGKQLWNWLTEKDRDFVKELAAKKEEEVTDDDRDALAKMMTSLLDHRETLQDKVWLEVKTSDEGGEDLEMLRARLDGEKSTDNVLLHRYNKQLLAAYFAEELRPPQLALVDVPIWKPVKVRVQALNAQEAFMIFVKASFVSGLVLASPWIFYQLWVFVAAGLYPHEKNYVYLYLPISIGLFFAGAALAFFSVFEPVLNFLFWFNEYMEIDPDPRIGEWLNFVLTMPLAFGVSFQLPLVMLFLNRIGIVSVEAYKEHWRVAILVIAVVAMILTPSADPWSMLLMMAPLVGLYFLGISMCLWAPRGRNRFQEVYEP